MDEDLDAALKLRLLLAVAGAPGLPADAAARHLDQLYGAALSKLAHKIIAESDFKYSHLVEFLDGNLDSFKELMNIKADLVLEDVRDE